MKFAVLALIVSAVAVTRWLELEPLSHLHLAATGVGTAILLYLRHRVRRRGWKGLWRWGSRGSLDEVTHFLGVPYTPIRDWWKARRARRRSQPREEADSGPRRVERTSSGGTLYVEWSVTNEGRRVARVRVLAGPVGLQNRSVFGLEVPELARLARYLETNDRDGMSMLDEVTVEAAHHTEDKFLSAWLRRMEEAVFGQEGREDDNRSGGTDERDREARGERQSRANGGGGESGRAREDGGRGPNYDARENNEIREARKTLGVDKDASEETIRHKMRKLRQHTHPDKGGSDKLFRLVNAAGKILLRETKR